jgi:glutathione synthase/RimK-type ligase-like ATP-grasp enzyme
VPTLALHPDAFVQPNGERQSFSARWAELAGQRGIAVRWVDAHAPGFFDDLRGCDGFMWRFGFALPERLYARHILSAVEQSGIPVFPSTHCVWHFEDKVAQFYLLAAAHVPMPQTWVFWSRAEAERWLDQASFPVIIKFAHGYRSAHVRMLRRRDDAAYWIETLFGRGAYSFDDRPPSMVRAWRGRLGASVRALWGKPARPLAPEDEWQHGYVYLQEFLPGNAFDTRVTVIGHRAFAFRRFNRDADFRASGSGIIDWDPSAIDPEAVRLAIDVASRLGTECLAVDVLTRGGAPVINEVSYTFASWAIERCPGHWTVDGRSGAMTWVAGQLSAEEAIFADFTRRLTAGAGAAPLYA